MLLVVLGVGSAAESVMLAVKLSFISMKCMAVDNISLPGRACVIDMLLVMVNRVVAVVEDRPLWQGWMMEEV